MTDMREAVALAVFTALTGRSDGTIADVDYRVTDAALSLMQPEIDRRVAEGIKDDHPEWGSVECKVSVYNDFHELAVEMGYPSMTEAFEALDEFRSDFAKCVAEERAKLLERLREPSEGMVEAGDSEEFAMNVETVMVGDRWKRIWKTMLAQFEKENSHEQG